MYPEFCVLKGANKDWLNTGLGLQGGKFTPTEKEGQPSLQFDLPGLRLGDWVAPLLQAFRCFTRLGKTSRCELIRLCNKIFCSEK